MDESTRVVDVMNRAFVGVSEGDSLQGTVTLMDEQDSGSAVVVRSSHPVGMVTERDVVAAAAEAVDFEATPVEDVMSHPVVTLPATASLGEAVQVLIDERIRRLPVLEDEDVVGVLSARDVLTLEAGSAPQATTSPAQPTASEMTTGAPQGASGNQSPDPGATATGETTVGTTQGICESCGQLARDLAAVDGRAQCRDCRGT